MTILRILQELTAPLLAPHIHSVIPSYTDDDDDDDNNDDDWFFKVMLLQPSPTMPHSKLII